MLSPDLIFSTSVNPHGLQKRATGPFRAPHYSVSGLALVGELELASAPGGVLYLQEFLEFSRSAVECLYGALSERLTKGQDVPQCIVCDVRLSLPWRTKTMPSARSALGSGSSRRWTR